MTISTLVGALVLAGSSLSVIQIESDTEAKVDAGEMVGVWEIETQVENLKTLDPLPFSSESAVLDLTWLGKATDVGWPDTASSWVVPANAVSVPMVSEPRTSQFPWLFVLTYGAGYIVLVASGMLREVITSRRRTQEMRLTNERKLDLQVTTLGTRSSESESDELATLREIEQQLRECQDLLDRSNASPSSSPTYESGPMSTNLSKPDLDSGSLERLVLLKPGLVDLSETTSVRSYV